MSLLGCETTLVLFLKCLRLICGTVPCTGLDSIPCMKHVLNVQQDAQAFMHQSKLAARCRPGDVLVDGTETSMLLLQKNFIPSAFVEEVSQAQGFSMEAAVNSVLSGSYGATINISMGPLAGRYPVSDALTAPIDHYVDTQRKMLMAVVGPLSTINFKCFSARLSGQQEYRLDAFCQLYACTSLSICC